MDGRTDEWTELAKQYRVVKVYVNSNKPTINIYKRWLQPSSVTAAYWQLWNIPECCNVMDFRMWWNCPFPSSALVRILSLSLSSLRADVPWMVPHGLLCKRGSNTRCLHHVISFELIMSALRITTTKSKKKHTDLLMCCRISLNTVVYIVVLSMNVTIHMHVGICAQRLRACVFDILIYSINFLVYLLIIYKVECLYVCLLSTNSAALRSTPNIMIHIMNHHDPGSALVHNSFALTVCWEVPLWRKLRSEINNQQSEVSSVHVQPCYKSRQIAEIANENK